MQEEILLTGRRGRLFGRLWSGDTTEPNEASSKDDGSVRRAVTEDRSESPGVLIAIHGLGDHGGRFQRVAEHLVPLGWHVFSFDLPGHGRSPGGRGRTSSFQGLLEDIDAARQTVAERLPEAHQFLLGHSMGGNLTVNYALRRHQMRHGDIGVRGVVLCAPMLLPPTPPPRPHIFAAWLTGHLMPWIHIDRPVDVESLTADVSEARLLEDDPLVHSRVNLYLATQLLSQGRWALDHARSIDFPLLVMLGDEDPLIDRSACEHLVIRGGGKAELLQWSGRRHDLFHDRGGEEVLARMRDWMRQCDPVAGSNEGPQSDDHV